MEYQKAQLKRQQVKSKVNNILQPMLVDILIAKPDNPYKFMRQWLTQRRQLYREQTPFSPTAAFSSKMQQKKL